MLRNIARFLLGTHPHNTFLSFNWHNVRHLNRFFTRKSKGLAPRSVTLADIGGGQSPYYPYFAPAIREYFAVDLKESLPQEETRPITQREGTAEAIPLEDASVDIVLCNQVLEHVLDPIQAVSEIHRILKPGGRFLGSVPHVSPIHLEPFDFRRYTSLGVRQLLENQGFETIEVEGNGGVFSSAALMIAMDLLLSEYRPDRPQRVRKVLSVLLAPIIGGLNIAGLFADKLLGDRGRTPANLCWEARKP